jgi:glycosyltransferase involved in cell wall biosynthesis
VTRFNLAAKVERADFVVCISHFGRSQLMALVSEQHWGKISIVHCGVDPTAFSPAPREADGDATEILCVGRLVPVKGQALVIEAVSALSKRAIDARATIVGAGPTRDRLEALAADLGVSDRIVFTGAVGQDRIRELYAAADVFCLPSFAEGVPVVLMEAMAMEVPVVTSRIMGIPELVEDGVSGLLVTPGDEGELVAALERLARDPAERRRLGVAGREKIVADYALDASVERLERLFAAHLAG